MAYQTQTFQNFAKTQELAKKLKKDEKSTLEKVASFAPLAGGIAGSFIPIPGVGTLLGAGIGGALGAGAGSLAKTLALNLDDKSTNDVSAGSAALDVGKEMALSGVGSLVGAGIGKGIGMLLPKALPSAASFVSDDVIRSGGKLPGKLMNTAESRAAAALKATPTQKLKFLKQTGKPIGAYMLDTDLVGKSTDEIADVLSGLQSSYDDIARSSNITTTADDVANSFLKRAGKYTNSVAQGDQAVADELLKIGDNVINNAGNFDAKTLSTLKTQLANYATFNPLGDAASGVTAKAHKEATMALLDALEAAAEKKSVGLGAQMRSLGREIRNTSDILEMTTSAGVKESGRASLGMRELVGAGIGGTAGSVPGAVIGAGVTRMVSNPKADALIAKALRGTAQRMAAPVPAGVGRTAIAAGNAAMLAPYGQGSEYQGMEDTQSMDSQAPQSQEELISMLMGSSQGMMQQEPVNVGGVTRDQLEQMMIADLMMGGKMSTKLAALESMLSSKEKLQVEPKTKLSVDSQKRIASANAALTNVDAIERLYQQMGGSRGRIGGSVAAGAAALGLNDPVDQYNQQTGALLSLIVRGLGEVGALTDSDIKRVGGTIPKVTDTPAVAQRKLAELRRLITEQKNVAASGSDVTGSGSLEDIIYQLTGG
jgi:hypothetical protein